MRDQVLFLDIEGVLNSQRTRTAFGRTPSSLDDFHLEFYDPVSIALIRSLCRYRKVSIVIGSSWLSNSTWKFLARQFDLPIIDATSVAASGKQGEIENWLMNHPSVKNFAILDGSGQNFSSDQNKRLIAVDNKEGMTLKNTEDLCLLFDCKAYDLYRHSKGSRSQETF